ncbi:hypothetical protein RyT2_09690 [Pseudolactococcus yaeyamensis]
MVVLEEHFVRDEDGNYWSKRVVNDDYLERYLNVFDEVTIFARTSSEKKIVPATYNKITKKGIKFVEIPDVQGAVALAKKAPQIILSFKKAQKGHDVVILRAPSPLSLLLYRFVSKKAVFGAEFMMAANKFFEKEGKIWESVNSFFDREGKRLCYTANGVSYVTEWKLQEQYPPRASEVISDQYFTTSYSSINLRKEFFKPKVWQDNPKEFVIVHVGFMDSYRKGQDILIEAVSILVKKGIPVRLQLVGDGEKKAAFEALATKLSIINQVDFLGGMSDKNEIGKVLEAAHLFVLPSQSEGLPRVIIEAMAKGLPVIASDVDGIPELVQDELMIHDFEPQLYADKIEKVFSDWNKLIEIGDRNYAKSLKFEASLLQEKRKQFYSNLKEMMFN